MTPLQRKNFTDKIQRILHVPGNYRGGILEFALVVDYCISREELEAVCKEMMAALKSCDKIFMNARFNLIKWIGEDDIRKEVSSMGLVQMGRAFEDYETGSEDKSMDELTRQLKLYYARSKIIIILSDDTYQIQEETVVDANKKPFLGRKMLLVKTEDFVAK